VSTNPNASPLASRHFARGSCSKVPMTAGHRGAVAPRIRIVMRNSKSNTFTIVFPSLNEEDVLGLQVAVDEARRVLARARAPPGQRSNGP
jgi:hypothetical protein